MRKLLILIWKNWLITRRKPKTLTSFFLSILLCPAVITIIRFAPSSMEAVSYTPFCINQINYTETASSCTSESKFLGDYVLLYSPENKVLERVMSIFSKSFREIKSFQNSSILEEFTANKSDVFAAIQFDDTYKNLEDINSVKKLQVSIRFPGELRYPLAMTEEFWKTNAKYDITKDLAGPREYDSNTGGDPNYYEEGFLEVQYYLTISLLLERHNIANKDTETVTEWMKANVYPIITMMRFPHAKWLQDKSLNIIAGILPYVLWVSFIYAYGQMLEELVLEKELQLKEMMKIMGLPSITHLLSWFIKYFILLSIGSLLLAILLTTRLYSDPFFYHSNVWTVFCFLVVFSCSLITFTFLVSTIFSKATTANFWSQIIIMLTFAPYLFMSYSHKSYQDKFGASFIMSTGFGFGVNMIMVHERLGQGLQWDNLFLSLQQEVALGWILIILSIDCVIYFLAAIYIDALFPGKYGVPKPWHFIFTGCFRKKKTTFEDSKRQKSKINRPGIEPTPPQLPVGIRIRNLNMQYGKQAVVKDLTMDIYQNDITVLLGHNGAGKTTTLSILLGLFPPTGGTAIIDDYDIRRDIQSIRKSLGYCPQKNILYKNLTVRDHFILFGMLKGLSSSEANEEADGYIEILNFTDKEDVQASKLSGGMKRKLCIGIALCGPSKFILLDEPTAGIDPLSKRIIWDTLRSLKQNRTILLTTHSMEEADWFGDRIAIMVNGELRCYGTSFFLKKEYGAGYRLIINKDSNCQVEKITKLLRQYSPSMKVYSDIGSELTYILEDSSLTSLGPVLDNLESKSKSLGILNFGISLTSLEEVFMKVGTQENKSDGNKDENKNNEDTTVERLDLSSNYPSGCVLLCLQFYAMMMKRRIFTVKWSFITLSHIFIPLINILFLAVSSDISRWSFFELPALHLNLNHFSNRDVVTLVENNSTSDYFMHYKSFLENGIVKTVDNITKEMMLLTQQNLEMVHFIYIMGATFADVDSNSQVPLVNITAWFNNDPYHTVGITMSYVLNTIYRKLSNCNECAIDFINYPLPLKPESRLKIIETGLTSGSNLVFCLFFAFLAVSAFFTIFVIKERVSKYKHQQFVSGVNLFVFWIATFLWDAMLYLMAVTVTLVSLAFYKEDGFSSVKDLGHLLIIFLYFGYAAIPLAYCVSYFFHYPSSGYSFMLSVFLILALVFFVIEKVVLKNYAAGFMHWLFILLPQYNFLLGLCDYHQLYAIYNRVCYHPACKTLNLKYKECVEFIPDDNARKYCQGTHGKYFVMEEPGIGGNLMVALIEGTVFFAILFFIDSSWINTLRNIIYVTPKKPIPLPDEDHDVIAEKFYIKSLSEEELTEKYTVATNNLTKCYGKKRVVNGIYLGIKKSECFGLVGLNGAGKTTTFRMISGDTSITYGDAWVNKFNIKVNLKGARKSVGYCAQSNAILEEMTPREAIITFCFMRGILLRRARRIVEFLASEFNFLQYLDKPIKNLSGGNQRKLGAATCLIGDPLVIYLDEPSSGLDPASKHYLWKSLSALRKQGKCILLTTHDMEECEALCTRLAIMVNGNFRCLGSKQELKSKFSQGYILVIKMMRVPVMESDTEEVEDFVYMNFPAAKLSEKIQDLLVFYIKDASLSWAKAFNIMESGIDTVYDIVDFTLSQGTLEQVFLSLTKHQDQLEK